MAIEDRIKQYACPRLAKSIGASCSVLYEVDERGRLINVVCDSSSIEAGWKGCGLAMSKCLLAMAYHTD